MMPGIDGVECCRRLKSELQTCHIPVILLTACSLDEQRIQGYDGGADSYISKPFSSQLLLARVRNLIDSHRRLKQFFGDGQALAKEDGRFRFERRRFGQRYGVEPRTALS